MPVDTGVCPVPRGRTWYGPEQTVPENSSTGAVTLASTGFGTNMEHEGHPHVFQDFDPGASPRLTKRSHQGVKCLLVRNCTSTVLYAGDAVTWGSGYRGKRVDGKCTTTAQEIAGFVDDFLPSGGVRNGDLFWLVVEGNCLVRTNMSNANAGMGDILYAITAATSQQAGSTSTCGKLIALNSAGTFGDTMTTNGTLTLTLANFAARAMTARTTTNTGGLTTGTMLINVRRLS